MIKHYNKLVRDNIPAIIKKTGSKPFYRKLVTKEDILLALDDKLVEEVFEYLQADTDAEKAFELVDIIDVVEEILKVRKYDIVNLLKQKRKTNGTFSKHLFLEDVEEKDE